MFRYRHDLNRQLRNIQNRSLLYRCNSCACNNVRCHVWSRIWKVNDQYWLRPNLCNPLLEIVTFYISEIFSNSSKTTHYRPPFSRSVLWFNAIFHMLFWYIIHKFLFYVCLFVSNFSSNWRIFHSYGDVNMTDEGLHVLTYTRHP